MRAMQDLNLAVRAAVAQVAAAPTLPPTMPTAPSSANVTSTSAFPRSKPRILK